jgi:hypothetical protein
MTPRQRQNQSLALVQLWYLRTMRRGVLVITALLSVLSPLGSVGASAHGGGLDSDGGHNCRVGSCAGTYHCHQYRGGRCSLAGFGTSAPVSPSYCIPLYGTELSKGDVARIQTALKSKGYDPGPIDGSLGNKTTRAINAFERSRKLQLSGRNEIYNRTITALGVDC